MLQAAAMRTAPDDPDGASGLYVTAFQVGIMAGSLSGGLLYEHAGLTPMIGASAALVMVALGGAVCHPRPVRVPSGNQQEVTFHALRAMNTAAQRPCPAGRSGFWQQPSRR